MPELLPLTTHGLTLERGGQRLVDTLDLEVGPGTLTVIMGPNGAGKSLLLRLLHGLIPATAGAVRWAGQPATDALRRRQAMVFQKPVLLRRSVAANISFVLKLNVAPMRSCDELLAQAGLASRAHQPARQLSGGEQQRLALARALASDPEILFLDEPTASLDPAATLAIERTVLEVHGRGTKIIYVTHDIGQAKRLADDVVFLSHGRLAEHSPAARFFDSPASEAAQAYLAGRLVP